MRCKDCAKFSTAPGMNWGACKALINTTDNVKSIIKGPDVECRTPQFAVEKEEANGESTLYSS